MSVAYLSRLIFLYLCTATGILLSTRCFTFPLLSHSYYPSGPLYGNASLCHLFPRKFSLSFGSCAICHSGPVPLVFHFFKCFSSTSSNFGTSGVYILTMLDAHPCFSTFLYALSRCRGYHCVVLCILVPNGESDNYKSSVNCAVID